LLIFILFSLAFIAGMAFAVLTGAAASGLFLLLTAVFFTCGVIPFWFRHGANVMSGNFDLIRNDEEPVPVLTIFFLMLSFACVGSFWYISELDSNYSGHLKKICDKYDDSTTWNVRGTILEEPKLKGDHLELIIKPEIIRRVERKRMRVTGKSQSSGGSSGSKRRSGYETVVNLTEPEVVKGGLILAQVFEDTEVFRQVDFNQNVEIEGQLFEPSEKRNPGSLDYRRYLRNRGVYRTVRIVPRKADLRIISETEGGSIWYRFALYIKDEVSWRGFAWLKRRTAEKGNPGISNDRRVACSGGIGPACYHYRRAFIWYFLGFQDSVESIRANHRFFTFYLCFDCRLAKLGGSCRTYEQLVHLVASLFKRAGL
jgi:hypothetical protein